LFEKINSISPSDSFVVPVEPPLPPLPPVEGIVVLPFVFM